MGRKKVFTFRRRAERECGAKTSVMTKTSVVGVASALVLAAALLATSAIADDAAVEATETKTEPELLSQKCLPNENNEFVFKVNLWEYQYEVEGCEGVAPTLEIKRGVEYTFVQKDATNWYHPLGLAYYPDGAHEDVP